MPGSNSSAPDATAPLEPVGLTVHSLPDPAAALGRQRRARGRLRMLLVLAVCAAPVVASYLAFYVVRPDKVAAYATLILPTVAMPDIPVRDLGGSASALAALKGQWLLVVVGDAACGKACEQRLYLQRQLREMVGRERNRVDKLWLVLDDAPVTPTLRSALDAVPAMLVRRAARDAVAAWLKPAPGHALEDHLYIVDPMGQWMMRAPADAEPSKLKRDLERLLRASSSWDRPGR